MDVPSTFNSTIRYSVPQYQRSTFDRAIIRLVTNVLDYSVTKEVFRFKAEYKARLQGFAFN
jgi:hypothetical protein